MRTPDFIYDIRSVFRRIKSFFYWGWKLRNNRDWDYEYLLEIIYLKMNRMELSLEERNHTNLMKRFRIAKECIRRLTNHNYEACIDYPEFILEGEYYIPKHKNPKKYKRQCDHSNNMKIADLERFCNILKKDLFRWWD